MYPVTSDSDRGANSAAELLQFDGNRHRPRERRDLGEREEISLRQQYEGTLQEPPVPLYTRDEVELYPSDDEEDLYHIDDVSSDSSNPYIRLLLKALICLVNLLPTPILHPKKHCTPMGQFRLFRKYFCYGQIKSKDEDDEAREPSPPVFHNWFYINFIHRRPHWVTAVLPLTVVWTIWLVVVSLNDLWWVFGKNDCCSTAGYNAAIVMLVGSFVAGATSEGGGSIAFPVFTLVLGIGPDIARDFSLMIQSVGMTSAAFTIIYSGIIVDREAIIWGTAGGFIGIGFGLSVLAPNLPGDYLKIIFVSIWFAFAINLFILNRVKGRYTYLTVEPAKKWKTAVLFSTGIVGGILSALSGSGLDICMFSVLTLFFRVSEKTATPTSVILMAGNTVIGFFIQGVLLKGIKNETWVYFCAAAPVVTVGAPVGAFVSSFLHRQILACFVYITDSTQFVVALIVTDMNAGLWVTCWALLITGLLIFGILAVLGQFYLYIRRKSRPGARGLEAGAQAECKSEGTPSDAESGAAKPKPLALRPSVISALSTAADSEEDISLEAISSDDKGDLPPAPPRKAETMVHPLSSPMPIAPVVIAPVVISGAHTLVEDDSST